MRSLERSRGRLELTFIKNIKKEFKEKKYLEGIKISACLHVTSETANLMEALKLVEGIIVGFPNAFMNLRLMPVKYRSSALKTI